MSFDLSSILPSFNSMGGPPLPSSAPLPSNSTPTGGLPPSVPNVPNVPSVPTGGLPNVPSVPTGGLPPNIPGFPSGQSNVLPSNVPSTITSNDNNEQLMLNDIQSLQNIEKDLFDTLETNPNLTSEQYNKIISKINSISQMRINLYKTFGNFNNLYKNTLLNSQETQQQQAFAIGIVEKQLNESKKKLQYLESEKNNKIRLIEINDYYGEKYSEHSTLMKYIIFMLIPIIIISFLFNKGFIPTTVFYLLLVIISIIGSIFIINCVLSILSRDNMNYQAYLWTFNMKNAPSVKNTGTISDPWLSKNSGGSGTCLASVGTCVGSNCCTSGMVYDSNLDKCIPDPNLSSRKKKESFMNMIFTKESFQNKKPDVVLNSFIMPSNY